MPGIGSTTWRAMAARFRCDGECDDAGAARALTEEVPRAARAPALALAAEAFARAARVRARVMIHGDPDWPASLSDLPDPPPALFVIGDAGMLDPPIAAIVGTRDMTTYGERVTRELAGALARAGATVLSGMARGIDGTAHRAALAVSGRTAAVLGTGVDVAYPGAHRPLHRDIAARGLLVSELLPGMRATGGSFPRRNRLIAALAPVAFIVEAGDRSGALITAGHALELGRTVGAVPGPIDAPASVGTNRLLRDGAHVIASIADALALVGLTAPVRSRPDRLNVAETAIWDALAAGPLDADTIAARTKLPARDCLTAISALEMAGYVECGLAGDIRRR